MSVVALADQVHSKSLPHLINKMIVKRQDVLVLFNRLAALKPYTDATPVQSLLRQFCQDLMDYLALGHFEVYQSIAEAGDEPKCLSAKTLEHELYPYIANTTCALVAFNDRYDNDDHCKMLTTLGDDLSHLGEDLADRIEWEDRVINTLLGT